MKIALAWLREEDWPEWRKIDVDSSDYETYEEWLRRAQEVMIGMIAEGHAVERVTVIPSDFLKWKKTRKKAGPATRAAYATEILTRQKKRLPNS